MAKKKSGGLCAWLARKHHKSNAWKVKCEKKAKRRHRGKRKSRSVNPWAVCSIYNERGTAKFERCVKDVKKKNRDK
jgi:hypothetical protein